jgi:hypothetical protein
VECQHVELPKNRLALPFGDKNFFLYENGYVVKFAGDQFVAHKNPSGFFSLLDQQAR